MLIRDNMGDVGPALAPFASAAQAAAAAGAAAARSSVATTLARTFASSLPGGSGSPATGMPLSYLALGGLLLAGGAYFILRRRAA